ncbi:MFS transporter [Nocardioides litoris]|uniref:MFS transporter n=1 Tax=Nocardioides litoris TaxID=1926648 RepID=UPI0011216BE2|nr:MFS transporter [Nocardioides litoris]
MTTTASETSTARTGRRVGAVGVAGAFALVMSFMTVPTPLYGLYEQRDGFGAFTVSLVFAAYGVGVVAGLVLAGHVSDHVGRRPVLVGVVALEVVLAVGFVLLADTASLLVLRFLTGLGVGGLSATATAAVAELHERRAGADPVVGRTLANVANLGGLAVGPLVAALLSLAGDPIVTPYAVYVGVLVVAGLLLWLAPETVPDEARARPWRYRPQRVGVDPEVRGPFVGASVAALAGFSVLGFITGLTGTFLVEVVGTTSRVEVGAVVTGVLAGGIVSQVLLFRAGRRTQLVAGAALVAVGVLVVAVAGLTASLPVFVGGGFLATGGVGLVFAASVATVAGLAAPERRGETLAALFLSAYVGITIPVVVIGALLLVADVVPVLVGFAVVVALAVPAGISVLVRRS